MDGQVKQAQDTEIGQELNVCSMVAKIKWTCETSK